MLYYSLQIDTSIDKYDMINGILGVKSNSPHAGWEFGIEQKDDDEYIHFIDYFLSILKDKYEQLEVIGVTRNDISVWMLYEYEGQCNMEFSSEDMYNLGKEGIVLCVSCWEK
ncbi:MAG: hypothetical protein FWF54_10315 [Candidatus Azobacteroides sp.]|nr:hypothetical protein [Candidatus Azobacteroides sp.]